MRASRFPGDRVEIIAGTLCVIEDDAIDRQPAPGADETGVGFTDEPLLCDAVGAGQTGRRDRGLSFAYGSRIAGGIQSRNTAIRHGGKPVKIATRARQRQSDHGVQESPSTGVSSTGVSGAAPRFPPGPSRRHWLQPGPVARSALPHRAERLACLIPLSAGVDAPQKSGRAVTRAPGNSFHVASADPSDPGRTPLRLVPARACNQTTRENVAPEGQQKQTPPAAGGLRRQRSARESHECASPVSTVPLRPPAGRRNGAVLHAADAGSTVTGSTVTSILVPGLAAPACAPRPARR